MTLRIVRFEESEFYYPAIGDITVVVPKTGNYAGMNVLQDKRWILPNWHLSPEVAREFTITNGGRPRLYLYWHYKGKDHKRVVGRIDDLEQARVWVEKCNQRYKERIARN